MTIKIILYLSDGKCGSVSMVFAEMLCAENFIVCRSHIVKLQLMQALFEVLVFFMILLFVTEVGSLIPITKLRLQEAGFSAQDNSLQSSWKPLILRWKEISR